MIAPKAKKTKICVRAYRQQGLINKWHDEKSDSDYKRFISTIGNVSICNVYLAPTFMLQ